MWDIAGESPQFVCERDVKLGQLQTLASCPDAPFVVCMGGDKSSDNMKVLDIRDSAQVRTRFGKRQLQNPLKTAEFGFATADEAEPGEVGSKHVDNVVIVARLRIWKQKQP